MYSYLWLDIGLAALSRDPLAIVVESPENSVHTASFMRV